MASAVADGAVAVGAGAGAGAGAGGGSGGTLDASPPASLASLAASIGALPASAGGAPALESSAKHAAPKSVAVPERMPVSRFTALSSARVETRRKSLTLAAARGYGRGVDPFVDLAPGADHDPLAQRLAGWVRAGLERDARRRDFEKLRGTVGMVVDDAGTALTLRFDFGRLTIHEGLIGVPTVTIRGAETDILGLAALPLGVGAREVLDGRRAVASVLAALRARRLKIYGLLGHPRFVVRFLRVLSSRVGSAE
jgi:hypothetical protein